MMKLMKRIASTWWVLSLAGFSLYLACYAAFSGFDSIASAGIIAVLCSALGISSLFALGISSLLALDAQQARDDEKVENMTLTGLAYILLVKRKPLLALLVLSLLGVGLTAYYVFKSIGVTFEAEESTLTIKLPGQTVHYFPIHSQWGWQNTGITLKPDQPFKYSLTGYVSPGSLQDIDLRNLQLREFKRSGKEYASPELKWPFTDPEGYLDLWYQKATEDEKRECDKEYGDKKADRDNCYTGVTKHYDEDTGLTVQGVAHNRVVAIILPRDLKPGNAGHGRPGYDYRLQENKDRLMLFESSGPTTALKQTKAKAKEEGLLWVVINDADAYRWDNVGLFFLKLVTR